MTVYPHLAKGIRWTARIVSGLLLGLFLAFGVGEAFSDPIAHSISSEEVVAALFLGLMLLGTITAYWRIPAGSLLLLAGYGGFAFCDGDMNLDNPFIVFPLIALLYGLAWILELKSTGRMRAAGPPPIER